MHLAAEDNNLNVAEVFLKSGANINARNKVSDTLIQVPVKSLLSSCMIMHFQMIVSIILFDISVQILKMLQYMNVF